MPEFNYLASPALLGNLERGISSNRLTRYRGLAGGSADGAMKLYAWNTAIAGALYGSVQALEVLTRNYCHDQLAARFGPDWYESGAVSLHHHQMRQVEEAKGSLVAARKTVSPPSVVAELSFGFWVGLFSRANEMALWRGAQLWRLFHQRVGSNSRVKVFADYDAARQLRNRIAHHECIIRPDLPATFHLIQGLIRTLCPDTAAWVQHHSVFDSAWSDAANIWLPPVGTPPAPD